jgi:methylenetetrahydrofolate reductase (NADPH)
MTTQMSFNPGAIAGWIERMRAAGISLPVHLGLPGVAELTKLMSIAARIGVADSARYLKKNRSLLGQVIRGRFGPDALLRELGPTLADPAALVEALHIFTFNQIEATVGWQERYNDPRAPTGRNTGGRTPWGVLGAKRTRSR